MILYYLLTIYIFITEKIEYIVFEFTLLNIVYYIQNYYNIFVILIQQFFNQKQESIVLWQTKIKWSVSQFPQENNSVKKSEQRECYICSIAQHGSEKLL